MARKTGFPPEAGELPSPVVDNHTHFPLHPGEELPDGAAPLAMSEQVGRAERAGVVAMIHSGCELPDLEPSLELARQWPQVKAALAIHPNETSKHAGVFETGPDGWEQSPAAHHAVALDEALARVAELARDPEVVAIGETGLDYFRTGDKGRVVQREAFRAHIALAKELGLPMQIHDRDAHADVVEILKRDGAPELTVLHCFSGDRELARVLNEHGWYASFAGPVTFRANEELREALRVMDPSLIMVETDAPYLTPVPYRGRPNASYVMVHTVESMAVTRGEELTQLCQRLTANTERVYGRWWG